MADQLLLDEYFTVRSVSSDRYERVSRLKAQSDDISLELDFNTQLYTVTPESSLGVQLATQLSQQLQDSADYIMHGKVYRIDEGANDRLYICVSFGGLLMALDGPYRKLTRITNSDIYVLLRK